MASPGGRAALAALDVAVLAGGLGTRIAAVLGDTPKLLAPIAGRPFLDHMLDWLDGSGAGRVVLCLGHLADKVTTHIAGHPRGRPAVDWVIEPGPLGTAGALRFARAKLGSEPALAINGDSYVGADLAAFVAFHRAHGAEVSMLCVAVPDAGRYGRVELDDQGRVRRFVEKAPGDDRPGTINAGIYAFSQAFLDRIAAASGPSLERDILQTLPAGTIHAMVADVPFIDIGTPESLAAAAAVLPTARTSGNAA